MRGALRQEWVRLRTLRSTWWLTGAALVATALLAVALTLTAGAQTAARSGAPGTDVLGDQTAFAIVLSSPTQLTTVFMGLVGVFAFGHDYRYNSILPALTVVPRRGRLAAARLIGVTAFSAAVGAACLAVASLVLLIMGQGRYAPGVGWNPTHLRVAAGAVLLVTLFGLFGLALGCLFRAMPVAVSLLFALPIAVEPLLRVILSVGALDSISGVGRYLPFTAGAQLVAYTTAVDPSVPEALRNDLTPLVGGLTLTAVVAVLLLGALTLFERRDA